MSRLIDRLKRDGVTFPDEMVIVDASQATPEFFEKGTWNITEDIPCMAPPWEFFFMEFKAPAFLVDAANRRREWTALEEAPDRWGVAVSASRIGPEPIGDNPWPLSVMNGHGEVLQGKPERIRRMGAFLDHQFEHIGWPEGGWVLSTAVYFERGGVRGRCWGTLLFLDHTGKCLCLYDDHMTDQLMEDPEMHPDQATAIRVVGRLLMGPAALALGMLNCKNSVLENHVPDPKVRKKAEKRYGIPPVEFKTLKVTPMGVDRRRRSSDHGHGDGLNRATARRGHFKTFTPDKPLFGRITGTFWWNPHMMGNPAEGRIVNDYEIATEA